MMPSLQVRLWTWSFVCLVAVGASAAQPPDKKAPGPLAPREALITFRVPKGFKVELVACEPDVIDPVAMAFDDKGRIFVAEMPGYPNDGVATGKITSGRIKLLEDKDGDGFYETSTIFLDGLRFPTSVMPYRGGLLVVNAPDLIYCEDTKGTGKADKVRTLYTGFVLNNIQQLPSGLQWGLDNWIHACAGGAGGSITSAEKPNAPAVVLRGRGFRFRPDQPASLEPTSGGGQFGLASDAWGHWFTATNSQHLRHIVLPDHYLRRNPNLPVSTTTLDIPDHGAACKVHRMSPYESWRVERTTVRKEGPDAKRFPPNELVPGGYITSACSPLVYEADLFPKEYRGNVFVCEPANNLIHRDVLELKGPTFVAKRAADEANCEFLASTDTWCRPVCLTLGPDGAIYVLDFYRKVIETPLSLSEDMKRTLPLKSQGKGRIWRIVPEGKRAAARPNLTKATTEELVKHLDHPNYWWRITAQRLLIERKDRAAFPLLVKLAKEAKLPEGRVHALCALDGLDSLHRELVELALQDDDARVRAHAVRLLEPWLAAKDEFGDQAVRKLCEDPALEVRFQVALSIGEFARFGSNIRGWEALCWLGLKDSEDPWMRTALLSSCSGPKPGLVLAVLAHKKDFRANSKPGYKQLITQLAALMTHHLDNDSTTKVLTATLIDEGPPSWQIAVLQGWGQGLKAKGLSLSKVWAAKSPESKKNLDLVRPAFEEAARKAGDDQLAVAERLDAIRLCAYGPFAVGEPLFRKLLVPQTPVELQAAAVRSLANHDDTKVGELLLVAWKGSSPSLRREILDALLARGGRVQQLLDAIEHKQVLASQLEPAKLALLRKHPDAKIRARAEKLLKDQIAPARQEVIERYQAAKLAEKPDAARGKLVFKKTCATCHRLENEGTEVGPDLLSALANKTPDALVIDILDPSREVDPRYIEYVVTTKDGRVITGLIAAETASSVTLRRADKAEDTLLRSQIDNIQATAKSLMPEGLEMQLNPQELYDIIAYLLQVAAKK
jgi:putative membrane-bound dehydrogenase-like protein